MAEQSKISRFYQKIPHGHEWGKSRSWKSSGEGSASWYLIQEYRKSISEFLSSLLPQRGNSLCGCRLRWSRKLKTNGDTSLWHNNCKTAPGMWTTPRKLADKKYIFFSAGLEFDLEMLFYLSRMLGGKQGAEVLTHERKHAAVSEAKWLELARMLESTDRIRTTELWRGWGCKGIPEVIWPKHPGHLGPPKAGYPAPCPDRY